MPWDDVHVPSPPGIEVHPTRLGELMPACERTQAERAAELERVCFVESQLAAYKAEIVAAMARDSSARDDRTSGAPCTAADGTPGLDDDHLPDVSEFFPDELALIMN